MSIEEYDKYIRNPKRIKVKNIVSFIYTDAIVLDLTNSKRLEGVWLTDDKFLDKYKNYYVAGIRAKDGYIELAITEH